MKWLPSLLAAEAIPSAMITFVALLLFVQLGVGWGESTLLCALLTLPWVLKSWLREWLQRIVAVPRALRITEVLMCALLFALAFSVRQPSPLPYLLFGLLFLLGILSACHMLLARAYYEQRLNTREQHYYNSWRVSFLQAFTVVTYGLTLLSVGALEVFFHKYRSPMAWSWSTVICLLAGLYLVLLLLNILCLKDDTSHPSTLNPHPSPLTPHPSSLVIRHSSFVIPALLCLFFLLLPQALMFHTRVLFLLAPVSEGGLGCSLQWIGLAQGTVGIIAFSLGLGLGHRWERKRKIFSSIKTAHVTLLLSPFVYYAMTLWPPQTLPLLCVATFVAQFTFGLGLNACIPYIRAVSGERYSSTINYIYIPAVALVMLLPMAISGGLAEYLGFRTFFAFDAVMALPAFLAGSWGRGIHNVYVSSFGRDRTTNTY